MDTRIFLNKVVNLIYRTKEAKIQEYEPIIGNSLELLGIEKNDEQILGVNKTQKLVEYLSSVNSSKEELTPDTFLPTLELLMDNDNKLFRTISKSLEKEYDEDKNKKVIAALNGEILSYIKEKEAQEIINKLSYETKFNRGKINNFAEFLQQSLRALEPYTVAYTVEEDPAVVASLDFSDVDTVTEQMEIAKQRNEEGGRYICGFDGVNNMTQGGFKPGETVGIGALQHKYKTGFSMSLFNQILTLNTPIMTEEEIKKGLKPLALRITLEDELSDNVQWSFQYQKCNEGEIVKARDLHKFTAQEMSSYVVRKLTQNGWEVKLRKINPTEWTVTKLFNYILQLEAEGYKVCVCMLDYLGMLPTTDCIHGPLGADRRDQLRRAKNFFGARGTLFFTPFQLNTAAKTLLKNGVPDARFLKEIAEKGYYDGCGTVDQELDLELYVHIVPHNGEKWLNIGRGKHRGASVLEREEEKFIYYKFPMPNVPILEDHGQDRKWFTSLPRVGGGDFGGQDSLVDEVLGM